MYLIQISIEIYILSSTQMVKILQYIYFSFSQPDQQKKIMNYLTLTLERWEEMKYLVIPTIFYIRKNQGFVDAWNHRSGNISAFTKQWKSFQINPAQHLHRKLPTTNKIFILQFEKLHLWNRIYLFKLKIGILDDQKINFFSFGTKISWKRLSQNVCQWYSNKPVYSAALQVVVNSISFKGSNLSAKLRNCIIHNQAN